MIFLKSYENAELTEDTTIGNAEYPEWFTTKLEQGWTVFSETATKVVLWVSDASGLSIKVIDFE